MIQLETYKNVEELLTDLIFVYPAHPDITETAEEYFIVNYYSSYKVYINIVLSVFLIFMLSYKYVVLRQSAEEEASQQSKPSERDTGSQGPIISTMDNSSENSLTYSLLTKHSEEFSSKSKMTLVKDNSQTAQHEQSSLAIKPPKVRNQKLQLNRVTPQEVLNCRSLSTFKITEVAKPGNLQAINKRKAEMKTGHKSDKSSTSEVCSTCQTISTRLSQSIKSSERPVTSKDVEKSAVNENITIDKLSYSQKNPTVSALSSPTIQDVATSLNEHSERHTVFALQKRLQSETQLKANNSDSINPNPDEPINSNKRSRDATLDGKFPLFLTFNSSYSPTSKGTPKMRSIFSRSHLNRMPNSCDKPTDLLLEEDDNCDQITTKMSDVSSMLTDMTNKTYKTHSQMPDKQPVVSLTTTCLTQKLPPGFSHLPKKMIACLSSDHSCMPQQMPDNLIKESGTNLKKIIPSDNAADQSKTSNPFSAVKCDHFDNHKNIRDSETAKSKDTLGRYGASQYLGISSMGSEFCDGHKGNKMSKENKECFQKFVRGESETPANQMATEVSSGADGEGSTTVTISLGHSKERGEPSQNGKCKKRSLEFISLADKTKMHYVPNEVKTTKQETNMNDFYNRPKVLLKKPKSHLTVQQQDFSFKYHHVNEKKANSEYKVVQIEADQDYRNKSSSRLNLLAPNAKRNKMRENDFQFKKQTKNVLVGKGVTRAVAELVYSTNASDSVRMVESLPSLYGADDDSDILLDYVDYPFGVRKSTARKTSVDYSLAVGGKEKVIKSTHNEDISRGLIEFCDKEKSAGAVTKGSPAMVSFSKRKNPLHDQLTKKVELSRTLSSILESCEETEEKNDKYDDKKTKVRDTDDYPMVLNSLIQNSKDHIQNTRLLCKSSESTVYEKLNALEAQGSGSVTACKMKLSTAQFPTLTSFLEHTENESKKKNENAEFNKASQISGCKNKQPGQSSGSSLTRKEKPNTECHNRLDLKNPLLKPKATSAHQKVPAFDSTDSAKFSKSSGQRQKDDSAVGSKEHIQPNGLSSNPENLQPTKYSQKSTTQMRSKDSFQNKSELVAKRSLMNKNATVMKKPFTDLKLIKKQYARKTTTDFRLWKKNVLKNMKKNLNLRLEKRSINHMKKNVASISGTLILEKDESNETSIQTHFNKTNKKEFNPMCTEKAVFATPDPTRGSENLSKKEPAKKLTNVGLRVVDSKQSAAENKKDHSKIAGLGSVQRKVTRWGRYGSLIKKQTKVSQQVPKCISLGLGRGRNLVGNICSPAKSQLARNLNSNIKLSSNSNTFSLVDKSQLSSYNLSNTKSAPTECMKKTQQRIRKYVTQKGTHRTQNLTQNKLPLKTTRSKVFGSAKNSGIDISKNKKVLSLKYDEHNCLKVITKSYSDIQQAKKPKVPLTKSFTTPVSHLHNYANETDAIVKSSQILTHDLTQNLKSNKKHGFPNRLHVPVNKMTLSSAKLAIRDQSYSFSSIEHNIPISTTAIQAALNSAHETCPSYTSKHKASEIKDKNLQSHWQGTVAFRKRLQHLLQHRNNVHKQQAINQLKSAHKAQVPSSLTSKRDNTLYNSSKNVSRSSISSETGKNISTTKKVGNIEHPRAGANKLTKLQQENKVKVKIAKVPSKLILNKAIIEKPTQVDETSPILPPAVNNQKKVFQVHRSAITHSDLFKKSTESHIKRRKENIKNKLKEVHQKFKTSDIFGLSLAEHTSSTSTELATNKMSLASSREVYKSMSQTSFMSRTQIGTDKQCSKQSESVPLLNMVNKPFQNVINETSKLNNIEGYFPFSKLLSGHQKSSSERELTKNIVMKEQIHLSADSYKLKPCSSESGYIQNEHKGYHMSHEKHNFYPVLQSNLSGGVMGQTLSGTEIKTTENSSLQHLLDQIKENFLTVIANRNQCQQRSVSSSTLIEDKSATTVNSKLMDFGSKLKQTDISKKCMYTQLVRDIKQRNDYITIKQHVKSNSLTDQRVSMFSQRHTYRVNKRQANRGVRHFHALHSPQKNITTHLQQNINKLIRQEVAIKMNNVFALKSKPMKNKESFTSLSQDSKTVLTTTTASPGMAVNSKGKIVQRKPGLQSTVAPKVETISLKEISHNISEEKLSSLGEKHVAFQFSDEIEQAMSHATISSVTSSHEWSKISPIMAPCTKICDAHTQTSVSYDSHENLLMFTAKPSGVLQPEDTERHSTSINKCLYKVHTITAHESSACNALKCECDVCNKSDTLQSYIHKQTFLEHDHHCDVTAIDVNSQPISVREEIQIKHPSFAEQNDESRHYEQTDFHYINHKMPNTSTETVMISKANDVLIVNKSVASLPKAEKSETTEEISSSVSQDKSNDSENKSKDSMDKCKDSENKSKDSENKSKDSENKSKDSENKSKVPENKSKDSENKKKVSENKKKVSEDKSEVFTDKSKITGQFVTRNISSKNGNISSRLTGLLLDEQDHDITTLDTMKAVANSLRSHELAEKLEKQRNSLKEANHCMHLSFLSESKASINPLIDSPDYFKEATKIVAKMAYKDGQDLNIKNSGQLDGCESLKNKQNSVPNVDVNDEDNVAIECVSLESNDGHVKEEAEVLLQHQQQDDGQSSYLNTCIDYPSSEIYTSITRDFSNTEPSVHVRAVDEMSMHVKSADELSRHANTADDLSRQIRAVVELSGRVKAADELNTHFRAVDELSGRVKAADEFNTHFRAVDELSGRVKAADELNTHFRAVDELNTHFRAADEEISFKSTNFNLKSKIKNSDPKISVDCANYVDSGPIVNLVLEAPRLGSEKSNSINYKCEEKTSTLFLQKHEQLNFERGDHVGNHGQTNPNLFTQGMMYKCPDIEVKDLPSQIATHTDRDMSTSDGSKLNKDRNVKLYDHSLNLCIENGQYFDESLLYPSKSDRRIHKSRGYSLKKHVKSSDQVGSRNKLTEVEQAIEKMYAQTRINSECRIENLEPENCEILFQTKGDTEQAAEGTFVKSCIDGVSNSVIKIGRESVELHNIPGANNNWLSEQKTSTESATHSCKDSNISELKDNTTRWSSRPASKAINTKVSEPVANKDKRRPTRTSSIGAHDDDDLESLLNNELSLVKRVGSDRHNYKTNHLFCLTNGQGFQKKKKNKQRAQRSSSLSFGHHVLDGHFERENSGSLMSILSNTSQTTCSQYEPTVNHSSRHVRSLASRKFAKLEEFLQKIEMVVSRPETTVSKPVSKLSSMTSVTQSSQDEQLISVLNITNDRNQKKVIIQNVPQPSKIKIQDISALDKASVASLKSVSQDKEQLHDNYFKLKHSTEKEKNNKEFSNVKLTGEIHPDEIISNSVDKTQRWKMPDLHKIITNGFNLINFGDKRELPLAGLQKNENFESDNYKSALKVDSKTVITARDDLLQAERKPKQVSIVARDDLLQVERTPENVDTTNGIQDEQCIEHDIKEDKSCIKTNVSVIPECQTNTESSVNTWLLQTVEESSALSTSSSSIVLSWVGSDISDVEEIILDSHNHLDPHDNVQSDDIEELFKSHSQTFNERNLKSAMTHNMSNESLHPILKTGPNEIPSSVAIKDATNSISVQVTPNDILGGAIENLEDISSRNRWEYGQHHMPSHDSISRFVSLNTNKDYWQRDALFLQQAPCTQENNQYLTSFDNVYPATTRDAKCENFAADISENVQKSKTKFVSNWKNYSSYSTSHQPPIWNTFLQIPRQEQSFDFREETFNYDLNDQSHFMENGMYPAQAGNTSTDTHHLHNYQQDNFCLLHSLNRPSLLNDLVQTSPREWSAKVKQGLGYYEESSIPDLSIPHPIQSWNITNKPPYTFSAKMASPVFYQMRQENTIDERNITDTHLWSKKQDGQISYLKKVHFDKKCEISDRPSYDHQTSKKRNASQSSRSYTETKDKSRERISLDEHLKSTSKSDTSNSKNKMQGKKPSKCSVSSRVKRNMTLEQHLSSTLAKGADLRCKGDTALSANEKTAQSANEKMTQSASDNGTTQSNSSHASLNWYKPQSLPSSTSVSNGNAACQQREQPSQLQQQLCESVTTVSSRHYSTERSHSQTSQRFTSYSSTAGPRSIANSQKSSNGKVSIQRSLKFVHVAQNDTLARSSALGCPDSFSTYSSVSESDANKRQVSTFRRHRESVVSRSKRQNLPPSPSGNTRFKGSKPSYHTTTASVTPNYDKKQAKTLEASSPHPSVRNIGKSGSNSNSTRPCSSLNNFSQGTSSRRTPRTETTSTIRTPQAASRGQPNQSQCHPRGDGKLQDTTPDKSQTSRSQSLITIPDGNNSEHHGFQQRDPTETQPLRTSKHVSRLVEMFERKCDH